MKLLQRVPAQYLWPLLLLLGLCFGSILGLIFVTTASQDRLEAARETRTLSAALETSVAMVQHDLQDYAKWDDAVRHIALRFSRDWINDNVTAYLGETQGYSHVFVVGPDGQTRYAFSGGKLSRNEAVGTLGRSLRDAMLRVRAMDPAGTPIVSGFTRQGEQLFVYAIAGIVPLTGKVTLPPGSEHLLIIAQRVDARILKAIERQHHLSPLTLSFETGGTTDGIVAVRDVAGRSIGRIRFQVAKPGSAFRREILPGFAVIMTLAFLAAGLILRQGKLSIAALRASQARTEHNAHHDALTGLPNRRLFLRELANDLAAKRPVVLLYMDLDGFKEVNDLYGHGAGDALLRQVAQRLCSAVPPETLVARTGGDEFAILSTALSGGDFPALASHLVASFQTTFAAAGANILIGVTIGVVTCLDDPLIDVDELMRRADVAMYDAKSRGKNRWSSFALEMDEGHEVRKRLEQDLRAAIAANEIEVAYQPIVCARTGARVCIEALARWTHPVEGPISPDVFIPLAEMTGMIAQLGEQVLRKACLDIASLDLDLAVNLSPAQFWDAHLADHIRAILTETKFPAARLELEITETYLLRRPDAALIVIEDLRALGIRLALDDFGTGFASVGYLQKFRFDRLKIDRLFVTSAAASTQGRDLLVAIVAIARALDLEITAEGVETVDQADFARAAGCHRLQGWHFGRPVSFPLLDAGRACERSDAVIQV